MDLPLIIMFACLLGALGGGAQQTVGSLASGLPRSTALPILVAVTSAITAFAMAYLGSWLSSQFVGVIRAALVAGALALAAFDLCLSKPIVPVREPTRSIGAIFLALSGKQAVDAPRWLAFAGGAAITEPLGIAFGATFGSAIALLGAWIAPEVSQHSAKFRVVRIGLAILAMIVAAFVVWIGVTTGG